MKHHTLCSLIGTRTTLQAAKSHRQLTFFRHLGLSRTRRCRSGLVSVKLWGKPMLVVTEVFFDGGDDAWRHQKILLARPAWRWKIFFARIVEGMGEGGASATLFGLYVCWGCGSVNGGHPPTYVCVGRGLDVWASGGSLWLMQMARTFPLDTWQQVHLCVCVYGDNNI